MTQDVSSSVDARRPRTFTLVLTVVTLLLASAAGGASAFISTDVTNGSVPSLDANIARTPSSLVIGYGGDEPPLDIFTSSLAASASVDVVAVSPELKFVVVVTLEPDLVWTVALQDPRVAYVELDGRVRHWGASWNGAAWNGAAWDAASGDGASWNDASGDGASWNGASWNGASWNGASWNGASWNGASWNWGSWNGASWNGEDDPDPGYAWQWGLGAVNAPSAWNLTNGGEHKRNICVIDSGVDYTHPDLANNIRRDADGNVVGYDFVTGTPGGMDPSGHGTHVAGIAAAETANQEGISGLAQALIMPVRVLDESGEGHESDVARAIVWCVAHDAHVITMSLGTDEDKRFLQRAVDYAWQAGAVLVASAGNKGCECLQFPAGYEPVIAVTAFMPNGTFAEFSSTGSWVDISAPGVWIASTFPGNEYRMGSGTSQATPFVAGAAALAWSANPDLRNVDVRRILLDTAHPMHGQTGHDKAWGEGALDAAAAVEAALVATPSQADESTGSLLDDLLGAGDALADDPLWFVTAGPDVTLDAFEMTATSLSVAFPGEFQPLLIP